MYFDKFMDIVEQNQWEFFGIEIMKDGEIIHKYDEEPIKRHPIYSATKTITSLAAGIARDEGRFSLDASVYDYLKEEIPAYAAKRQINNLKRITIKRLLTMSVQGYPFRPAGNNWLEYSLLYPLKDVKTAGFSYSNISAYLAGVAIEKAVGENLYSYLYPRLFEPLDIIKPVYLKCPSGYFYGASGMELTVNELGRIGQLLLQKGNFNGRQIVSEAYVEEAVRVHQMNAEGGYGYFIWKYKDGYCISGKWGQRCIVLPGQQLIITYLAHLEQGSEGILGAVKQYLLQEICNEREESETDERK